MNAPTDLCHCGHERRVHDPCSTCKCPFFRPMERVRARTYSARATEDATPTEWPHEAERQARAPDRRRKVGIGPTTTAREL